MNTERLGFASDGQFLLGDRLITPSVNQIDGARIDPKAMDVLVAMVEAAPAVMSAQVLLDRVWPDVVVVPNVVYQAVAQLRKALGDDPRSPRYVESIPRRGYRLIAEIRRPEGPVPSESKPAVELAPSEPLLAVLAFDNLSGDADMGYFSDGVSEEIQMALTRGANLKVIGRTSSFQLRGANRTVRKAAAELKATHVLDGSVRRSGNRVRIAAQLIDCASEVTLWTKRFDSELTDIFALQDEIAAAVAAALKIAFAPSIRPETVDPEAHDLYLSARALHSKGEFDSGTRLRILAMLERAIAIAPSFARAWSELASQRAGCIRSSNSTQLPRVTRESVVLAVETALRLDPASGVAYFALAHLQPWGHYIKRESLLRKALLVAPYDSDVRSLLAGFCAGVGRHGEAFEHARRALDVDPLHVWSGIWYAGALGAMGRYAETTELWNDFSVRWPDAEFIMLDAAHTAANNRDWERFEFLVRAARERGIDGHNFRAGVELYRNLREADPRYVERLLRFARNALAQTRTVPLQVLYAISRLGLLEDAFQLADQASFAHMFSEDGSHPTANTGLNPGLIFRYDNRAMIQDARFVRLCAKLGLCDYWTKTDRWPDCVDQVDYDFRAESRRLIAR